MYKQRHPRKFIPQNINFAVFLRGESSSRESFFPLKYKSSERDVSSIPIMLEYEGKHSRGIVVVYRLFRLYFGEPPSNSANLHAYAFIHPLRRTTQWEIVLNHTGKEITCLWLGKQTSIPHDE